MTQPSTLWGVFQRHAPRRQWISTQEIFSIIESHSLFDHDDLTLHTSNVVQWKVNVRRLLQAKKRAGALRGRARTQD
jgi:hypothetical protein